MTAQEQDVLERAVAWRQATLSVERAFHWMAFLRALDLLLKERRDAKSKKDE